MRKDITKEVTGADMGGRWSIGIEGGGKMRPDEDRYKGNSKKGTSPKKQTREKKIWIGTRSGTSPKGLQEGRDQILRKGRTRGLLRTNRRGRVLQKR